MTDLSRKALLSELSAIQHRNEPVMSSKGPVSAATAQSRYEMAHTLKTDIENGVYDVPGSSARDFYIDTIRARWDLLTTRQRRKLYKLDSLLKIAVQQLADPRPIQVGEPTEPVTQTLPVSKERGNPWQWPLVALVILLGVVGTGVTIALTFNP